mgnify:FL=1
MVKMDEFIDAYSDDLLYLLEARRALITHPLMGEYAFGELLNASFCRLFIAWVVQAIEIMLQTWQERDQVGVLSQYFKEGSSNRERVEALCTAFHQAGIAVDPDVFNDFLAIKYLRNTIVHGRWKDHEKEWLDLRNFPTDVRRLTKEHLDKISHVYQNMMFYIFLTSIPTRYAPKPERIVKLEESTTKIADVSGILTFDDINRIIWRNLERIAYHIYQDIKKVVCSEKYNWAQGLSIEDVEQLEDRERKRLFYLSAWRAGKENEPLLARHRPLAKEALAFWHEYWQRPVVSRGLDEERIHQALQVLTSPHFHPELWVWSYSGSLSDEAFAKLLDAIWPKLEEKMVWGKKEVEHALLAGKLAYELLPNITPLILLGVYLPIVDPANVAAYCREAKRALSALKLGFAWYYCVEHHKRFTGEELDQYILLCEEFIDKA